MPNCPYCNAELRIRLTAQFVSEVDDQFWAVIKEQMSQAPPMLRRLIEGKLNQIGRNPMPLMLFVCANCDTLLNLQQMTSN